MRQLPGGVVVAGLNTVTAGATHAGNITLLNVLAAAIPAREQVVTIEDSSVQRATPSYLLTRENA